MNKSLLTGRITKDLEKRVTQSGTSVIQFTLAVNRRFKQEGQPDADFIRCIAWGKTAETMNQYLHKGSLIGVEGRITTGTYQDKDGKTVYTTDVTVEAFDFLESRSTSENQSYAPSNNTVTNEHGDYVNNDYIDNDLDISSDDLPF